MTFTMTNTGPIKWSRNYVPSRESPHAKLWDDMHRKVLR